MTKDQIKQIKNMAKNSDIKYLYLFGSQALDNVKPRSDFDFAVKFNTKKIKDTFKAKLNLMNNLTQIVRKEYGI